MSSWGLLSPTRCRGWMLRGFPQFPVFCRGWPWSCDHMLIWPYDHMIVWPYWSYDHMAVWSYDRMIIWSYDHGHPLQKTGNCGKPLSIHPLHLVGDKRPHPLHRTHPLHLKSGLRTGACPLPGQSPPCMGDSAETCNGWSRLLDCATVRFIHPPSDLPKLWSAKNFEVLKNREDSSDFDDF